MERTLSKYLMRKWWNLEDKKLEYYDWSVNMLLKMIDEIKRLHEEWDREIEKDKEGRKRRREEEGDRRDERFQHALHEYMDRHGKEERAGYKSIAKK